jgi:1-acyl-sn-glycerol-3-phosphate acyltransferase
MRESEPLSTSPSEPEPIKTERSAVKQTADVAHGAPPLELLDPFERRAFRFMDMLVHEGRFLSYGYSRYVGPNWIWTCVHNLYEVHGLERLRGLSPRDGIMLVANHRSFFDLYFLFTALYHFTHLQQPVFCPVRADFFYQRPLGIAVNFLAGGGRMYPPVFREPSKQAFNKWSVAEVASMLRQGDVLVGMHPEGRRNKNDDPYTPLPAQPGIGKLVMDSWPVVVPAFINGLGNNIVDEILASWRRSRPLRAVLGEPADPKRRVIAVFGEPIDLGPFRSMSNRLASHKKIADRLLATVYELGQEERRIRAEFEAGR